MRSILGGLICLTALNACLPAPSVFPQRGEMRIEYTKINVTDSLTINASSMSLDGWWGVHEDRFFYVDKHQVPVKYYDTSGRFVQQKLRRGRGPNELLGPPSFLEHAPDGKLLYIDGNTWTFYRMNPQEEMEYQHKYLDDIIFNTSDWNSLLRDPDPENVMMYELGVVYKTFAFLGDWIIFPIVTEHVGYNGLDKMARAREFYRDSYTLGAFNRQTFFLFFFFGHYPPVYQKKMIPNFMDRCVAADGQYLYVSYEADPLIYAYDDRLEPAFAFGFKGAGMKTDYPETSSVDEALSKRKAHRQACDFYGALQYVAPYLFRSYTSGGKACLQVYENGNLVGDLHTGRKEFQLMGYIAPCYYACVACDIDGEAYRIIKFTLEQS